MKTFIVHDQVFKTKIRLQEHIKEIITRSKQSGSYVNYEDTLFMISLIDNYHPTAEQKKGVGIKRMWIATSPYGTDAFFLERIDGTTTEFSYTKCLNHPTDEQIFTKAARYAIEEQIKEFKASMLASGPQVCPYTGEILTYATSHVDHTSPFTFKILLKSFLDETQIDWKTIKIKPPRDNCVVREYDDDTFNTLWKEWHHKNAKLRLLSRSGNLSNAKIEHNHRVKDHQNENLSVS